MLFQNWIPLEKGNEAGTRLVAIGSVGEEAFWSSFVLQCFIPWNFVAMSFVRLDEPHFLSIYNITGRILWLQSAFCWRYILSLCLPPVFTLLAPISAEYIIQQMYTIRGIHDR